MDVIDELRKRYDEAATLWQQYDERLTKFRAQVKNDVTALEAGARKTTEAVQRMNKAYADTFAQLNSPDMMAAIQNAERLAAAMQSISNLQPHKLMFAVVDSTKGE